MATSAPVMKNLNGGGSTQELRCVELVPKRKKLNGADKEEAVRFAKGMPSDPDKALVWMGRKPSPDWGIIERPISHGSGRGWWCSRRKRERQHGPGRKQMSIGRGRYDS